MVEDQGWWANSFFALSVILSTLVYLIIWSTLYNVAWVSLFVCEFMWCSLVFSLRSHYCWKQLFALFCVSNFVLTIFLSEMYRRLVHKASKAIRKEKCLIIIKKFESQFPRKVVISIGSFPKTSRNSWIAKPYFAPWYICVK